MSSNEKRNLKSDYREDNPMAANQSKIQAIIHSSAVAAAGAGAGFAQLPGSDSVVIVPIQTAMIISIAYEHGVGFTKAAATRIVATYSATMGGRFISQVLVGWIPFLGNTINAGTAAGLTEAIGWGANAYFNNGGS